MEQFERADGGRRSLAVVQILAVGAIVYFARPILVPLGLAILLAFAVSPLVVRVQRLVRSRSAAIAIVTVALVGLLAGGALVVGQQLASFAEDLPAYRETIVQKIRAVRSGTAGPLGRAAEVVRQIGEEAVAPQQGSPTPASPAPQAPAEPGGTALDMVRPIAAPLGTAGVVLLLLVMVLRSMESIRDRAIRLAGLHQIALTTQTLQEAGARVGRYLRTQAAINAIYGTVIGTGLWLLGIPNAALCGALAGVLRFAPVVGPWLGAGFPLLLALAVFPDWYHAVAVGAMIIAVELVVNTVIEPWLYGASTGLSPLGVVLALLFWTWVWGGVGLVLAVPMTVCLLVFARQVPQLGVVSILLGDEPALTEPARYYQRLLCRDDVEAAAILAAAADRPGSIAVLDEVFLPGLAAARSDLARGLISPAQAATVAAAARDTAIEWVQEAPDATAPEVPAEAARVLCIPVADALDDAAAAVLAALLERDGFAADTAPVALLASERIAASQSARVGIIVCSSFDAPTSIGVRRMMRAIERRGVPVIMAHWLSGSASQATSGAGSLAQAVAEVRAALAVQQARPAGASALNQAQ